MYRVTDKCTVRGCKPMRELKNKRKKKDKKREKKKNGKKRKKKKKKKRKKYKSILKSFWPITRWALAGNCLSTDSVKPLFLAVISCTCSAMF